MQYKVLSQKEARILAAIGSGIIPSGGIHFEIGAIDLKDKWLPKTDHLLSRMPLFTKLILKFTIHIINYLCPILYYHKFKTLTKMDEKSRTKLFHIIENSGLLGPVMINVVKVLVFPSFYGLQEVKDAIGYEARFPDLPEFEGLKD